MNDATPAPDEAAPRTDRRGGLRRWTVITLAVLVLFLLDFTGLAAEWRISGLPWPLRYPFLWQLTGHLSFLAVLPLLLRLFERFPLRVHNYRARLPVYLLVMCGLTLLETVLRWASRVAAYRVLGWGAYDYGDLRYVLPMELVRALPGYFGALGVYSLVRALDEKRERALAAERLGRELVEARLGLLKAQLHPHFLFNALNMIRTYVHEDARVADEMVGHLADFLRLALRHAAVQEVPLATELEFLHAYLAIMKARFEEQLQVTLRVEEGLGAALIPHLVLQPLVENAIRSALGEHGEPARIEIAAAREGDRLILSVADNGPGTRAAAAAAGFGVGLSNTRDRLRGLYGDAQRLDAGDRPGGGFEVRIDVPHHLQAAA